MLRFSRISLGVFERFPISRESTIRSGLEQSRDCKCRGQKKKKKKKEKENNHAKLFYRPEMTVSRSEIQRAFVIRGIAKVGHFRAEVYRTIIQISWFDTCVIRLLVWRCRRVRRMCQLQHSRRLHFFRSQRSATSRVNVALTHIFDHCSTHASHANANRKRDGVDSAFQLFDFQFIRSLFQIW